MSCIHTNDQIANFTLFGELPVDEGLLYTVMLVVMCMIDSDFTSAAMLIAGDVSLGMVIDKGRGQILSALNIVFFLQKISRSWKFSFVEMLNLVCVVLFQWS